MTDISHHPKTETLAAFAAGALDEARAVVVAAHLSMCADCRRVAADFEALGAETVADIDPEPMAPEALEHFWTRAGAQEAGGAPSIDDRAIRTPEALRRSLAGDFEAAPWRGVMNGFSQVLLDAKGYRPGALRLLKIEPGFAIPKHTHGDGEFTLILKGAYEDELGVFARGDFADLDSEDTHSPVAIGSEPCICLIATNAPLVFRGLVEKIAQRFIGL